MARRHEKKNWMGLALCVLTVMSGTRIRQTESIRIVKDALQPDFQSVNFNGRVRVNGSLTCDTLETANLTVMGDVNVETIKSSRVSTTLISADVVETGVIRSPTNTITIDGNLVLAGANAGATSFLATEVIVGGVKQWRLLSHDDFDRNSTNGWDAPFGRNTCGTAGDGANKDWHLGGYCNAAGQSASKTFSDLPAHDKLRITARVHFLDKWDGEVAFMRVGGNILWADTARLSPSLGNMCGGDYPDSRLSVPIDVSFDHEDTSVEISFGSSLVGDACEHSWAVDDVMLYAK